MEPFLNRTRLISCICCLAREVGYKSKVSSTKFAEWDGSQSVLVQLYRPDEACVFIKSSSKWAPIFWKTVAETSSSRATDDLYGRPSSVPRGTGIAMVTCWGTWDTVALWPRLGWCESSRFHEFSHAAVTETFRQGSLIHRREPWLVMVPSQC
jgi:hypothetical protein